MSFDAPAKPWEARDPRAPLQLAMTFEGDALVLGAGTRLGLAKRSLFLRKRDGEAFDEARVAALLAGACGRAITPSQLAHVRGALVKQSEGQTPLALVHLALAGLPKLQPPAEAAWRLSAADELMKRGMAPGELMAALGIGNAAEGKLDRAYNPDQPRVPAGSGRSSGQWTSGDYADDGAADDATSPPSAPNDSASDGSRGVQIADASDDWLQYLNPIGSAEAAGSAGAPFNGVGPNAQHQLGVNAAIAHYEALGYGIFSRTATAVDVPGFSSPRVYDFVVQSPDGLLIGVEVKTTLNSTIFLNPMQVAKDVALMLNGGGVARVTGASILGVAYTTSCISCSQVDVRSIVLYGLLKIAKVSFSHVLLP